MTGLSLEGRRNYRDESDLREKVAATIEWERVTPESRRVFLATYFPIHPRLHVMLDTFADYRVALFRQPHRIDHHCHLQNLHVQGGHLRQILGFLTRLARYNRLDGTAAFERLRAVPASVYEMQRCGAGADEIYDEVLERSVHPFLRDTETYPHLFRLVMQTFYSDHNRLTDPGEIARTRQMLEGLVDYVYLPRAVELDVWSEDLRGEVRQTGVPEEWLARVRPKRQLVIVPVEGRAGPEIVARLDEVARATETIRTGQLLTLARRVTDDGFFQAVLQRSRLRLTAAGEGFIKRWTRVFLDYYDAPEMRAAIHPLTISNKVLELFLVNQAEREATTSGLSPGAVAAFRDEVSAFMPKAKGLMKDMDQGSRSYLPYLEAVETFSRDGACLVFEAHPAAHHFDTNHLTNQQVFEQLMMPVYRIAAAHGLTGLELNRGDAFNEMVLEVAERLGLHLSVGSDFHSLSLSRAKPQKSDREYGCVRSIPAALFHFPNLTETDTLSPLQVARSIGHLVDRPIPDEPWRFGHWRPPRSLSVRFESDGETAPGALHVARHQLPPYALPAELEERTWNLVQELERRFVSDDGLPAGALVQLVEYVLLTQRPIRVDGDTPEEVAVANSVYHGVRALELVMAECEPSPGLPLALATILHDVARAYGTRDDTWYEDDYERHKDAEMRHAMVVSRRILHDVLFPHEHHAAVLFLVGHHERGSAIRDKAILRANTGVPVERMRGWCRAIDLADTLVFFEPPSIERYLRRRGEDKVRRKIRFSLALDEAGRARALARVDRLLAEGRYSAPLSRVLDAARAEPLP